MTSNATDRAAADAAYRQALETAKTEHDAIEPKIQALLQRRVALRSVIRGCSDLLGESLDNKYDWRVTMEQMQRTKAR